jgi:RNA-binding protein
MALNDRQKKHLRGLAHQLHPYVTIGDRGLTPTVAQELELALSHHELVKVRLNVDRDARRDLTEQLSASTNSELVIAIGRTACYFRRNPDKPRIKIPN